MKKLLVIIFISNMLFCQPFNSNQINFTLSTSKNIYLVAEPIYIECEFKNNNTSDVSCGFFHIEDASGYEITLKSATGQLYRCSTNLYISKTIAPVALLKEDQSLYSVFNLLDYFGESSGYYINATFLPVGEYHLQITYYTNPNIQVDYLENGNIKKHPVVSNTINLKIIEMNSEQHNEWEMCKTILDTKYKLEDFIPKFNAYFEKYPNSEYDFQYPVLQYFLLIEDMVAKLYPEYNKGKNSLDRSAIIDKMKNHYAINQCTYYIRSFSDFDEVEKQNFKNFDDLESLLKAHQYEVNFVHDKFPNTKLEKYIQAQEIGIRSKYKFEHEERERRKKTSNIQSRRE